MRMALRLSPPPRDDFVRAAELLYRFTPPTDKIEYFTLEERSKYRAVAGFLAINTHFFTHLY
jgi:hypothetical protein